MLPFLKSKKIGQVIIAKIKPEGQIEAEREENSATPELIAIAESLISAIHMKDAEAVALALEAAVDACGMYEHEEEGEY